VTTDLDAAQVPAPPSSPPRAPALRRWCALAAATTAAAGVLHVFAAVDHVGAHEVVVGFFLVTALGQLASAGGLAVAAVTGERPDSRLVAGILVATVGLVVLYLVAHTTDLLAEFTVHDGPAGLEDPHGADHNLATGPVALSGAPVGSGEPPGLLGTATVAVELLSVVALTALLPPHRRRLSGNVLLVLGAGAWLLWLTGVLG
jgi:hypothetical protein